MQNFSGTGKSCICATVFAIKQNSIFKNHLVVRGRVADTDLFSDQMRLKPLVFCAVSDEGLVKGRVADSDQVSGEKKFSSF